MVSGESCKHTIIIINRHSTTKWSKIDIAYATLIHLSRMEFPTQLDQFISVVWVVGSYFFIYIQSLNRIFCKHYKTVETLIRLLIWVLTVYQSSHQRMLYMYGSRGGGGGGGGQGVQTPWKIKKNIGFLSNTGPDPLNNHKATMPAFNVGPPSARQWNRI